MDKGSFLAVLTLFCLAVLAISDYFRQKKDRETDWRMEWKMWEAVYRIDIGLPDDEIEQAKTEFFRMRGIKP